jgi:hypothetical protein
MFCWPGFHEWNFVDKMMLRWGDMSHRIRWGDGIVYCRERFDLDVGPSRPNACGPMGRVTNP